MDYIRKILLHYFEELNMDAKVPPDDIQYRVDKCLVDIERAIAARKDFKEGRK